MNLSRSTWPWVAAGLLLLALAGFWNLAAGMRPADEAWFLQVVARVHGGEALYRDVFFGSTPLAVWLATAVTHVAGVEIGVVKALRVACFVASALIAAQLVRQTTERRVLALLLLAAALLLAAPGPNGLYSPLAELLLLATALLGLRAHRRERQGRAGHWLLPGLLAGLCLAAKQTTGACATLALAGVALLGGGPPRAVARRLALIGGAVVGVCLATAGLVAASGGFAALADQGFYGKVHYREHAPIPYGDGLVALLAALRGHGEAPFARAVALQAFLLAPVVGVLAAVALLRARGVSRHELVALALFAAAAFASVFPRADASHLVHAVPALLALGACAWQGIRPGLRVRAAVGVEAGFGLWIAAGLAIAFGRAAEPVARGELAWSTLPRLRGALIAPEQQQLVARQARGMRAALGPEAFLVSPRAGFWYLVTGVRNPTRWDWPGVTSMGARGQEEAVEQVRRGAIERVCLDPLEWGLEPRRLEAAIAAHMEPIRDLGPCVLYVARPKPSG